MKYVISIAIAFACLLPSTAKSDDNSRWPLYNAAIGAAANTTNKEKWDRFPWGNLSRYQLSSAPLCEADIEQDFSVSKALEYIRELESLVLREGYEPGRRWEYPTLGTAEGLIHYAQAQLEQVMNYGILRFHDYCITCDPRNYLSVAQRLIEAYRKVYGEVDGTRNFGLVQSVIYWLDDPDAKIYCGDYSNQTTPPSWLIGDWELGRDTDSSPICKQLSFAVTTGEYGRKISPTCRYSESYYWSLGDKLIFINPIGQVTSIFDKYIPSHPIDETYFFGTSYPDGRYGLYLYNTCSGTVSRGSLEWQRCTDGDTYAAPSINYPDHYSAMDYCEDLELNGATDWRLPTLEELRDLVYCSTGRKFDWPGSPCNDDSQQPTIYPEFQARYDDNTSYITSSNSQSDPDYSDGWYYHIYFGNGGEDSYSASRSFYVRCVRDK